MSSLQKTLLRGSIYIFLSTVVVRGVNVLRSGMVGRLLDPDSLGILAIYDNLGSIIVPIIMLNLNIAATKFIAEYMKKDKEKVGEFFSTIFISLLIMAVVGSVIYFLFSDMIGLGMYNTPILASMIRIVSIFIVISAMSSLFLASLGGLQKFGKISLLNLLSSVVSIPLLYFFIVYFSSQGTPLLGVVMAGVALGLVLFVASAVVGTYELKKAGISLKLKFNPEILKKTLKYSGPITLGVIALPVSLFVVNSYMYITVGAYEAGLYRISNFIFMLLMFAPTAISAPFMPVVSQLNVSADSGRKVRIITKVLRITALVALPIAAVGSVLSGLIIYIIYGEQYLGAIYLTSILSVTAFFASINAVMYTSVLLGTGKTWQNLLINILQGAVYIVVAIALIDKYGLIGMGYGFLIQVLIYTVFLLIYLRRCDLIRIGPLKAPILLGAATLPVGYILLNIVSGSMLLYFQVAYLGTVLALEYLILKKEDKKLIMDSIRSIIRKGDSGKGPGGGVSGERPPSGDISGQL